MKCSAANFSLMITVSVPGAPSASLNARPRAQLHADDVEERGADGDGPDRRAPSSGFRRRASLDLEAAAAAAERRHAGRERDVFGAGNGPSRGCSRS